MSHPTLSAICDRFRYLSPDVVEIIGENFTSAPDQPQMLYECNRFDPDRSRHYTDELDRITQQWAACENPRDNPNFIKAMEGLRRTLKAVTATSAILARGDALLVERPGIEADRHRKLEITSFCKHITETYSVSSFEDRLSLAQLSLLGITPLPLETVNYLDIKFIPQMLGRILARLDNIEGKATPVDDVENALKTFMVRENSILAEAGLERVGIPIGTRPRIYVPSEAIALDERARLAALEVMQRGTNRADSMYNFLTLLWRDFADEAFVALHKDNHVDAYALVAGCCYYYQAVLDKSDSRPTVRGIGEPMLERDAGAYILTSWRRTAGQLSFEGCPPPLVEARHHVMQIECLPATDRKASSSASKQIRKAAGFMLGRQIDHNMTCVLNGEMGAPSVLEWSPNMSRDRYGKVFNHPHAFGGVDDMFRGCIAFGDHLSQLRTWREREGTHHFAQDASRFKGYQEALKQFLNSHAPST